MVLAGFDVETYKKNPEGIYEPILDATGKYFILGAVVKEGRKGKTFFKKEEMWDYIKKLGIKELNHGHKLVLYGHNTKFDFFNIVDWTDRNIRIFSEDPFIASYYHKVEREFDTLQKFTNWTFYAKKNRINYRIISQSKEVGITRIEYTRECIKFLDTISLFGMSLERLGNLINYPKMKMPIELGKNLTNNKLIELGKYCRNDCKVSIEAVRYLKSKLAEDGINIRNLCTINQIAISYIINKLQQNPKSEHILKRIDENEISEYTHKTSFANEIHSAYRGNVRVWKTGYFNNITDVDFNSLYPHSIANMDCPDLRTERIIEKPKWERIKNKIGITRALIYNESDELGILQIRMDKKSYVPTKGKYLIGTWTNMEIQKAIENGYKIIDIEWSIMWDKGESVFKDIYKELYTKRKASKTEFDNYFYKMIMVSSIGKFAQTKTNQEILVDSIEEINNYLSRNYRILNGIEGSTDIMYINTDLNKGEIKKYYAPIIPTLVTAYSRCLMYDAYKKIGVENLIYSDTDSIIFNGSDTKDLKIGNEMGEWKIEKDSITGQELKNTDGIIWGTKTKRIGNNIAMSGVFKADLNKEQFNDGKVISKKMMGIKNTRNEEVGKFIYEFKDLKRQTKEWKETEELLQKQILFIDKGIDDISFYGNTLKRLGLSKYYLEVTFNKN